MMRTVVRGLTATTGVQCEQVMGRFWRERRLLCNSSNFGETRLNGRKRYFKVAHIVGKQKIS